METVSSPAESLLCSFLARRAEDSSDADFEAFCGAHGEHAEELRQLMACHAQLADGLARVGSGQADAGRWRTVIDELSRARLPRERYYVGKPIGAGGMGAVFEAVDRDFDRSLCMKVMHQPADLLAEVGTPSLATRSLSRFVEEARLTGRLDHPGIVPVHDLGVDEAERVFFTMKRVQGRDLEDIFAAYERGDDEWTEARLVSVLQRACEAVAYAHSRGVVHRDLKPANIMVGGYGETYVMDWGLAVDLRPLPDEPADGAGRSPEVVGTPLYMAPEQASGLPPSPTADIYGMGAVLYRLLTARAPYDHDGQSAHELSPHGLSPHEVIARVRREPPEPLSRAAPRAAAELAAICERAMARRVDDRYGDMRVMAADLRAYLENRVVSAHRTGAWVELVKWVQRNKAVAAAGLAAVLAIVAGVAAVGAVEARAAERLAEENAKVLAANERIREESASRQAALDFMVDMFDGADPHRLRGPDLKVVEVLDSARRSLAADLESEPRVHCRLAGSLARVYGMLGKPNEAHELVTRSLAVLDRRDIDDESTRRMRRAIADYDINLGRFDAAERTLRGLLAALDRLPAADPEEVLATRGLLGYLLSLSGDYPAAIAELDATVAGWLRRPEADPREIAKARHRLGYALMQQGHTGRALEVLTAAHDALVGVAEPHDRQLLAARMRLGEICANRGELDQATRYYQEAKATVDEIYPDNHPDRLALASSLATILTRRGQLAEALPMLQHAYDGYLAQFGPDHRDTWIAAINLAWAHVGAGALQRAESLFQQVHDQIGAGHLEPHATVALRVGDGLCRVWQTTGRGERAIALLRDRAELLAGMDREADLQETRARLGKLLFAADAFDEAVTALRPAWLWLRENGSPSERSSAGSALTAALLRLHRGDDAFEVASYEREHAAAEATTANLADLDFNLVQSLIHAKRLDEAGQAARRALEFVDANLPVDSPQWGRARMACFDVEMHRQDYDAAESWVRAIEASGSNRDLAGMMRGALERMRQRARDTSTGR